MDDTLIYFGGEVKALGSGKVGGYLARFSTSSDPDLARDFFTPETDFYLEDGSGSAVVIYDHGLDATLKARKLGRGKLKIDDVGLWVEAQLAMRDDYEKAVYELAKAGKLGWSSGSAPHLVTREKSGKAFHLKAWPIVEASLTPNPCEPRCEAVSLKSYQHIDLFADIPSETEGAMTLEQFSESVVATLEEIATKAHDLPAWAGRMRNRIEFRAVKDGRRVSGANKQRISAIRARNKAIAESLLLLDPELEALELMAEPRAKESQALDMSIPIETGKSVELAMLSEMARFEALRFNLAHNRR